MKYYRCKCCGATAAEEDIEVFYQSPAYPSEAVCPACGSMMGFECDEVNGKGEEE